VIAAIFLNYLSFFATPTMAQAPDPTIEQQINIIDQEYKTTSTTYVPTDNSLGIVNVDVAKYSGETFYFEAVLRTEGGGQPVESYQRIRSGNVSLAGNKNYTVRLRFEDTAAACGVDGTDYARAQLYNLTDSSEAANVVVSGDCNRTTAVIRAARIIIVQADATNITDTQTQIELGDNEMVSNSSYSGLSAPKYFYLDKDKFDGTISGYVEATMIRQQGSGTQAKFMSGFETGDETEWTSESATATTAQFRSGGYSVLLNDTGSEFVSSEVSTMAQLGLRFGLRLADSTPSSTQDVLTISQTTTNIWIIHILTDGKVRVQNLANSTNYDSSGAVFSDNTWHLVEFNGLVHNSTGNFDLRVDGAEVITQSSLDTDPAVATLNRIRLDGYASGVGDIWVDDVYWINTLSYPGDGKIVALQPNASGDETSSNWLWDSGNLSTCTTVAATYGTVADTPKGNFSECLSPIFSPDSYIYNSVTAGGTILFGLEDASVGGIGSSDTINDVWYRMWARRGNGSSTVHAIRKKWAGTAASSSDCGLDGTGILCSLQETGTLSVTNVDSAQLGADKQSGGRQMDVETEWMMVDYTPETLKVRLETATSETGSWTAVSGSEVTSTSSWSLVQSSDIWGNITDDRLLRVAVLGGGNLANAKLIIKQTASGGLTKLETVHQYVNTLITDADSGYTNQNFINQFTPSNWVGGTFTYTFEANLKTSAGTGYAKLKNVTPTVDEIDDDGGCGGDGNPTSEISTTITTYYDRVTSSALNTACDWPSSTKNMDTIAKNSASNTTSVTNSWLIIDVTSLQIPENLLVLIPIVIFVPSFLRWRERRQLMRMKPAFSGSFRIR